MLALFGTIHILLYASGIPLYHHSESLVESIVVCHLLH